MAQKRNCCNTCAYCSSVGRLVKYCGRVATVYDCRLTKGEINTWWASLWGCSSWQSRDGKDGVLKQMSIEDMAKDGTEIWSERKG